MKRKTWALIALLGFSLASGARAAAQTDQNIVAVIENIEGRAFWRKTMLGEVRLLHKEVDTRKILYPEEAVMCDPDDPSCEIVLSIDKQKVVLTSKNKWYILPNPPAGSPMKDYGHGGYGRGGNIDRGVPSEEPPIYSPSQGGAVWPEHFVVRWIPETDMGDVTIRIWPETRAKNREIWYKSDVRGAVGYLDSEELRRALLNYREQGGSNLLELHFTDNSSGVHYQVNFTLLSIDDDQDLQKELANWADHKDMIGYIGRANAFDKKLLYVEATEEYEEALKETPNSRDLLARTILANRMTGNYAREQQLNARLSALSLKRDKD